MTALPEAASSPSWARRWLRRLRGLLLLVILGTVALLLWNLRPPSVAEPHAFPSDSPPKAVAPIRLKVVTWNVWGLLWLTPRREERLNEIARQAAALHADIIGFQEAWVETDRAHLREALKADGLEYSRYFASGLVGSGLLLVSRYPIEADGFVRYASNGYPWALTHGDWWAGKGLSLSIVKLRDDLPIFVANTHLHARYKNHPYHETQLAQAGQLHPWAEKVKATGMPALWLGDWNSTSDSDVLAPLIQTGGWQSLDKDTPHIDHIFGSGPGWEWRVLARGTKEGFLPGEPKVPWSDHRARWVEVELSRQISAP